MIIDICLSICPHIYTRIQLDNLPRSLLGTKCLEIPSLIQYPFYPFVGGQLNPEKMRGLSE